MKKLITLLAGYAAGIAVAMKYRKDHGTSKLQNADTPKWKIDSFIDEVVDIHKSAFADLKSIVQVSWEDVEDFDALKIKLLALVESYSDDVESAIAEVKSTGEQKKTEVLALLEKVYTEKQNTIESARKKALSFADVAHDTLDAFLADAKTRLDAGHDRVKAKIETL
jgi:hypothetical protein